MQHIIMESRWLSKSIILDNELKLASHKFTPEDFLNISTGS